MKTIQIRNVPDHTHRELRTRAAAAGVSLSDYILEELKRVTDRPTVAEVMQRAAAMSGGPTTEQIVAAIRAVRDERD